MNHIMRVRPVRTILFILMNSSGEVAHGGNSTLSTEVPSSWCPNLYSLSLDNISGRKNSSGINSCVKEKKRIMCNKIKIPILWFYIKLCLLQYFIYPENNLYTVIIHILFKMYAASNQFSKLIFVTFQKEGPLCSSCIL